MSGLTKTVANIVSPITNMLDMGGEKAPAIAAPAVAPPVPMPDPKAQGQAKRRSIAEQMRRQGRASTILTDTSNDTLGG